METLKLEFIVRDRSGNIIAKREIDYIDEYNLDQPSTKQRFVREAAIAVEDARNTQQGADLCCPKCQSRAIRVMTFNFVKAFCRACKYRSSLRDFRSRAIAA